MAKKTNKKTLAKKTSASKPAKSGKATKKTKPVAATVKQSGARSTPKKPNVTFLPPSEPITKLKKQEAPPSAPNQKPVTEIAFSSSKEERRNQVQIGIKANEVGNLKEGAFDKEQTLKHNNPQAKHSNVTYITQQPSPVANLSDTDVLLKEISDRIHALCNSGHLPRGWEVADAIKRQYPQVTIEYRHPSPDTVRQTKYTVAYNGKSINCPENGYYSTNS